MIPTSTDPAWVDVVDALSAPVASAMMTTSLPPSNALHEVKDFCLQVSRGDDGDGKGDSDNDSSIVGQELDLLSSRLNRFMNAKKNKDAASIRKTSIGSHIPKPEVAPKPVGLVVPLKSAGGGAESLKATPRSSPPPAVTKSGSEPKAKNRPSSSPLGTTTMLKSTLKRMTRISVCKDSEAAANKVECRKPLAHSRAAPERQHSGAAPVAPAERVPRQAVRSSSMRKSGKNGTMMTRSLTGSTGPSTLERRSSINRSHSVRRGRDTNAWRKSRGVQTLLTRDALDDADVTDAAAAVKVLEFALYIPEVLGTVADAVETHVDHPPEPLDVRKNRQLMLDNLRLQRETERLRAQAHECESLRRELRSVHAKLEDEQRSRERIEEQLDCHNEKVRAIAQSMDCVEREFEHRDENIHSLEQRLAAYKSNMVTLQEELDVSNEAVAALQQSHDATLQHQKLLLAQYHEAEAESKELQEFLQAEKMTLAETLRDCEAEISSLQTRLAQKDVDVAAAEDRCSHLVRLGEQRHQEILALQTQLASAKEMLLAQGAEISRANIHVSELYSRLEKGTLQPGALLLKSPQVEQENDAYDGDRVTADDDGGIMAVGGGSEDQFMDGFSRSNSEFLLAATHSSSTTNSSLEFPTSESLQNLSKAIAQRQQLENGQQQEVAFCSTNGSSLPSLVDKISEVQLLVDKIIMEKSTR